MADFEHDSEPQDSSRRGRSHAYSEQTKEHRRGYRKNIQGVDIECRKAHETAEATARVEYYRAMVAAGRPPRLCPLLTHLTAPDTKEPNQ